MNIFNIASNNEAQPPMNIVYIASNNEARPPITIETLDDHSKLGHSYVPSTKKIKTHDGDKTTNQAHRSLRKARNDVKLQKCHSTGSQSTELVARNPTTRTSARSVKRTTATRGVHVLEAGTLLSTLDETDPLHFIEDGSVPTKDLPSIDGEESVIYLARNVPLAPLAHAGADLNRTRPRWAEVNLAICHLCYDKGYISPCCTESLRDFAKVIGKYKALQEE